MKTFRDLFVWQKAHRLVLDVYLVTNTFPRSELYGLTSQMRRSAVSVSANIVEGFQRRGRADFARFLDIAAASLEELQYYVLLGRDLDYFPSDKAKSIGERGNEVGRMLYALWRKQKEVL